MSDSIVLEQFKTDKTYSNIKTFDCGNAIINKIPRNLKQQVQDGNVAAYALVDLSHTQKDFFAGFYTISSFSIAKADFEIELKNAPKSIPCLRLIMLGIDLKYQGNSLGSKLMKHAMKLTIKQAEEVGIRGLYLDAADGKHDFYANLGFKAIKSPNEHNILPMFLSVQTIRQAFVAIP